MSEKLIEKAMEPFKRTVRKLEADAAVLEKRMNTRIDRELKETINLIDNKVLGITELVEHQLRLMQKVRAKDKSDNDIRFKKNDEVLSKTTNDIVEHNHDFDTLAKAMTMLIENVNMQIEAEISDLSDRQMMSLFAG